MAEKKKIGHSNELIYGAHAIIEVLKAKRRKVISIYTTKPLAKSWDRIQPYLNDKSINIQYVSRAILDRMAGTTDHNNILAWVTPFKYHTKPFDPQQKPLIIMLDAVQDVRNLGAILRSAYCTGVQGVVLCKTQSAPMTGAAFKASAGLAEYLDIYLAPSMHHAILEHKKAGYHFYMAALGGQNALETNYQKPACIVIGNEATGISKDIQALGTTIMLPQKTTEISYNASVAAGILLFLVSTKLSILS
ncbi:MAG: RNA methyltransferase, TrmH family, group 3 [candidate division TM6 bacterium GW2011_GWF2_38_10]|nr:MAG: RNA methyltransferase, TrmH family, group 3 [candidate division TM6 bacterium GW2011_GWF2_38_10]